MKLLTYLIYTLLITCMLACGSPKWKKKKEMRKKRIEMRDSVRTLHPDTIVKYREIRWTEKKAKIDAKFDRLKAKKEIN